MVRHRKAGLIAVLFVLACMAKMGSAADVPKPTSGPAASKQSWKLPTLSNVGCFTVADGQYAVLQDLPGRPAPTAPVTAAGLPLPAPVQCKWYLLNLKTGTLTNLADLLKEISGDFKGDLEWVEFSPVCNCLIAHTGIMVANPPYTPTHQRYPWWFDLAAKKGVSLLSATGTQCFWLGDRVIQYEPRGIDPPPPPPPGIPLPPSPGPIEAMSIDVAHNKFNKCKMPGTVVAVSDKGNMVVCHATLHFGFRDYRPAYAVFGIPGSQLGSAIAGDTTPTPQFVLSPGSRYVLATTYDDPNGTGGVAGLSAKTRIIGIGKFPIPLAKVSTPLYISDSGRAMTRTDKGVILVWDAKGKESEVLVKDALQAGVWHGNLYYISSTDGDWQLNMMPLPQLKETDPKSKHVPAAGT
jgi:hypothetical protein